MTIMGMTEFHIIMVSLLLITIHSMINLLTKGKALVYKPLNLLSEPLDLLSNFALI